MANSDKNILITPNTGSSTANPTIRFTGADNTPITLRTLDNGTVSFEGTAGQLFSISDGLSGTIFSVNDISGIPSIEVVDTGLIKLNQYNGSTVISGSSAIQNSSSVNAKLSVYTASATSPGFIIKGAASQSANLQEWQNSAGTPVAKIEADGNSKFKSLEAGGSVSGIENTTTIDTASETEWRTLKYLIQAIYGSEIHSADVIIANDTTDLLIFQYGDVFTSSPVFTVTTDKSGGIINLKITPIPGKTPISVKFFRIGIRV